VIVLASPAASQVVPGILGFLVVAAMALALFFLLRSMNKQLNKVAREPRWREEAKQAQQEQAEPDYSKNGTPQQG
jgi:large-conductance mechanosensitive channel